MTMKKKNVICKVDYTMAILPTVRLLSCQFLNFFVKILFDQQRRGIYLTLKNLLKQSTISNQMLG